MQRHWKRPWISLFVLAAVAGSTLARPIPATRAQTTTYPGESDPIGKRAGALSQFPDDELATVSASTSRLDGFDGGPAVYIPPPDYSAEYWQGGFTPRFEPTTPLQSSTNGYQPASEMAKGRFVDPDRDVALTLTKVAFTTAPSTTGWALQEVNYDINDDNPSYLPARTWSTPVLQGPQNALYSPGALAAGDVDGVVTINAADDSSSYNDEAVVAYEVQTGTSSQVQLDVVSYVATPGQATVVASTSTAATNTGTFAYPCTITVLLDGACRRYPGTIEVAVGDMDGDGYQDIVLFTLMNYAATTANTRQAYLYSVCPSTLAADDPRVGAGICAAGAAAASLTLRGTALVDGSLENHQPWSIFASPAEITVGDFDGDGGLELAVLHQTYASFQAPNNIGRYPARVTLSLVQWTGPANKPKSWQKVWTNEPQNEALPMTNTWSDDTVYPTWYDMHLAAGLFKFNPELGYGPNRRQLAVAWTQALPWASNNGNVSLQVELWDLASPNSPGQNPPQDWTLNRYSSQTQQLCANNNYQAFASFELVAGNWAGVKLDFSSSPEPLPLWGVGLIFQGAAYFQTNQPTRVYTQLYRVDQNVDPTTANGPLTLASSNSDHLAIGQGGGDGGADGRCGYWDGRVQAVSLDFDGDSLQLGAPMHTVVQVPNSFDWILQEPPQHLDYFPNGGLVNVSRSPAFNVGYTDAKAKAFAVGGAASSSWNAGTSVKANGTFGVEGDFLIAKANMSVSVTNQFNFDYQQNQSSYIGTSDIYTSTVTTQTAGGDSLRFRSKIIDIWRYPVYGTPSPNPGQPFAYYELSLPRQNDTPDQDMDDLAAQTYGYQPPHENGNLLSYPAVAAGDAFTPGDIGPWLLPTDSTGGANAQRCENGIRWCVSSPLTDEGQQFSFGGTKNSLQLAIDQSQTNADSRSWTSKLSDSLDVEASAKFVVAGVKSNGCVNAQVHAGYSWGESHTKTYASDETQALTINVPANNDSTVPYHFNPMMYITGDGTLKVAHAAGTDNGGSFWTARYLAADPALNLPRKFNQPSGARGWELNKDWLDAQQLRGFWVRSATPNPVTNTYDVVDGVKVGQPVLLDARVYNYSVGTATGSVPVRFDLEPVDPANNYQATGPRVTAGTIAATSIAYHGQEDSTGDVLDNYASVRYQLDTSTLQLPAGSLSQTYRVWVVLDAADPANTAKQTHGWRQPNVIVTPEQSLSAGTTVTLALQDASGTVLDTVSYTSQGTDDNIAAGLAAALNSSAAVLSFGAKASVQDTTTSTPSVVVYKSGAQPPSGTEYRAGMVAGSQALYVVPPPTPSGVPLLTATNLEYGQNNEGWGLLTVNTATMPGPMLGGNDPCGLSSGLSAERGPDIQLRRAALSPMPAGGRVAGGKTTVRAGERVPIRVSAFANTNWAGFERVTVFQGEPEAGGTVAGTVAGTALIRGIDKQRGGHGWFSWQAPSLPGTYTLVAQLQESPNDATAGNNAATVEIVVEPGKALPYRTWLGAVSGRPE